MDYSLPKEKKLISISEAAKMLGVSIDTIRRWDKSGILQSSRPDGKNRYFSIDELEKVKLSKPYSISDVAKYLNLSQSTLRRLEARGLIKPDRNSNGERTYNQESLEKFLQSEYFLRRKKIQAQGEQEEKEKKPRQETIHREKVVDSNLKPLQRIPEFLAAVVVFLLLLTLGIRNIPTPSSSVLSETKETEEMDTAPADAQSDSADALKPKIILTIKVNGASASTNILQKPSTASAKLGTAKDGDTFEFLSLDSGWYEVKLATDSAGFTSETGFISAEYIVEENK